MLLKTINRKVRLYKKFESDIWGFNLVGLNSSVKKIRLLENLVSLEEEDRVKNNLRYVYRIDTSDLSVLMKKQKWKFLSRRVSKLYFFTLSYKQFNVLLCKASKMEGFRESNYIMLVENRLFSMLYRMQFVVNIFELRSFIFNKNVLINNKIVTYPNMKVWYGDILQLVPTKSKLIKLDIIRRFMDGNLYFTVPDYMFVSYKLMFGFVYREPSIDDITYPNMLVDIYRVSDIL